MTTALPKSIGDLSLLDHTRAASQVNSLILSKTGPIAANTVYFHPGAAMSAVPGCSIPRPSAMSRAISAFMSAADGKINLAALHGQAPREPKPLVSCGTEPTAPASTRVHRTGTVTPAPPSRVVPRNPRRSHHLGPDVSWT